VTQIPFLSFSDSIAGATGLARIHRDIITRAHRDLSDIYRVGSLGIGGPIASSSDFPFFNCSSMRMQGTVPLDLGAVWANFAGRYGDSKQEDSAEDLQERGGQVRKGILVSCINISWAQWLAQPYLLPLDHPLRNFLLQRPPSVSNEHWLAISTPSSPSFSPALLSRLNSAPFQRWLYCPVDGHLPDGTLGHQLAPVLAGFDRVLAYTRYGAEVIEKTLEKWGGQPAVSTIGSIPNLPHGLDTAVWFPRDRSLARQTFFSRVSNGQSALPLKDDQILACMCGTNSSRKTWGEFFQTGAELLRRGVNIFLWGHTDLLQPQPAAPAVYWNLPALAKQFGLEGRIALTTDKLTDDQLAWAYSAADVMIATSSEGWGYPPMEALGCGLSVVGTTYAGSAEFTSKQLQVEPISYSLESPFLIQRCLHDPRVIADKVVEVINFPYDRTRSLLDSKYEWENCWPRWMKWLKEGVE
jgi:glycosyltransferase involved in cell wall biosynthesis